MFAIGCTAASEIARSQMVQALAHGDHPAALHLSLLRSRFAVLAIVAISAGAGVIATLLYVKLIGTIGRAAKAATRASVPGSQSVAAG
ncbi:hypothetical protein [Sphingomonas turrisvirgatae]|uniref:Uncharacterized protein n=1 Tax=Sphingomonas turrisvirgatae TaxID=1888892 RepID=A0A1E3LXV3_9SPHN|nr:hypothetical protein [Sphingomonas turrisvirgatae]ODP38652.1 hypothetical protein BFL28_01050 [Sphingomonas turrisvirgatae]